MAKSYTWFEQFCKYFGSARTTDCSVSRIQLYFTYLFIHLFIYLFWLFCLPLGGLEYRVERHYTLDSGLRIILILQLNMIRHMAVIRAHLTCSQHVSQQISRISEYTVLHKSVNVKTIILWIIDSPNNNCSIRPYFFIRIFTSYISVPRIYNGHISIDSFKWYAKVAEYSERILWVPLIISLS